MGIKWFQRMVKVTIAFASDPVCECVCICSPPNLPHRADGLLLLQRLPACCIPPVINGPKVGGSCSPQLLM